MTDDQVSSKISFGQYWRQRLTSLVVGIFLSLAHQMPLSFSMPQMQFKHFFGFELLLWNLSFMTESSVKCVFRVSYSHSAYYAVKMEENSVTDLQEYKYNSVYYYQRSVVF